MQLHIGGKLAKEGWKILNIQPGPDVDYVGDISNLMQFKEASCDRVYASHVLEHIPQKLVLPCLKGIRRILKPGGQFLVSVPDWDVLCRLFIDPQADVRKKWHAMRMMMGGQLDAHDFHQVGFNQTFMFDFLHQAGFVQVKRVETFDLFDDFSVYKPYGFPISLNVIATK